MKMNRTLIFLVTFVLTLFALTTSTAAWISLPRIDTFDNIQFNVLSDAKMQLSFDGINYYDNLNEDIINMYFKDKLIISDATSNDGLTFGKALGIKKSTGVFQFDIYFRADRAVANDIYLINDVSNNYDFNYAENNDINGTYVISKGKMWAPEFSFDNGYGDIVAKNEARTYYASTAMRIAFNEQNVNNDYLLSEDIRSNLSHFIFDPSGDETRSFGEMFGAYDYLTKKDPSFKNIKIPETIPNVIYGLSNFNYETNKLDSNISKVASFQMGSQDGKIYKYAKVHVSIWLEGWDPDCIDAILSDISLVQFKFICADPA